MLDHSALTPEALAYYNELPLSAQIALNHSNLTFRTLEDLQAYQTRNLQGMDGVLFSSCPNQISLPMPPSTPWTHKTLKNCLCPR